MQRGLAALTLTLGLAWAAAVTTQTVEVLNADGRVVATGGLSGHLRATGDLRSGRTLRVTTTVNGRSTVRTFVLAAPITARDPEAERLGVRVGNRVLPLEAALDGQNAPPTSTPGASRGGADDGPNHDAGDDHGRGGHGADDGAGHDAGDDHGGKGRGGGGGSDDGGRHR